MTTTQKLNVFTDGSMIATSDDRVTVHYSIGAAWHIANTTVSFQCGVVDFLLSTRAELMAIMTVLLAIPMNRTVMINTDSQAAIQGIQAIMTTTCLRSIYKLANNALLGIIKQLITAKNITAVFNKVKGHSNDSGNDKADSLAKEASLNVKNGSLGIVTLDGELGYNMNYGINWKGHLVEGNLRKFNCLVSNGLSDSNWSLGSIWDDPRWNNTWTNPSKEQDYEWSIWWSLLRSLNHFNCRSFKTHRLFAFIVKISHYLLPTIDKLHLRSSKYNALSCPAC